MLDIFYRLHISNKRIHVNIWFYPFDWQWISFNKGSGRSRDGKFYNLDIGPFSFNIHYLIKMNKWANTEKFRMFFDSHKTD